MDVAITGASGLIGTALVAALGRAGHRPIRLVRTGPTGTDQIAWDPAKGTIDAASLDGVDAIVNLAGAGIGDHRWTDEYKQTLVDSRVRGTDLLARTIELTEESTGAHDFLAELCRQWEAATAPAAAAGVRVAHLRTGIVLSSRGGALKKQLPLFKLGVGGRMGSGKQWQSWISLTDHVGATLHLLQHDLAGPVNLTAPNPVTSAAFAKALGAALHRPSFFPVPSFGPKLLLGGELTQALLLSGQRVLPARLQSIGFAFRHPTIDEALKVELARA